MFCVFLNNTTYDPNLDRAVHYQMFKKFAHIFDKRFARSFHNEGNMFIFKILQASVDVLSIFTDRYMPN